MTTKNMTLEQLVESYRETWNKNNTEPLTKRAAREQVNSLFDVITLSLKPGPQKAQRITIPAFGTFTRRENAPRKIATPSVPGRVVDVPAKWSIRFRPGKYLRGNL